ncbi:MAG: CHAD domain-containing protein [Actinomycetota bacterium]|nr:CHAD domain-containing protein [Actinomycetota bacterium]
MAYRFEPGESVSEAILRCSREQLDRAIGELSEGVAHDPAAAVHSARKAVKKERSLLRLARGAMSPRQRRRENRALRAAARGLADVRDAHAMTATITTLAHRFAGQLPESTFRRISEQLELAGDGPGAQLTSSALNDRAVQEVGAVRLRVDEWKISRGGWKAIETGMLRSYRRGRKAFARAQRQPTLEDLHAWRKRVKDLWYMERLLESICGPAVRGQAKDAHRLADLLGDDHDLGVLRQTLARYHLDVAVDLDAVIRLIDHRRAELQTEAIRLGGRVYAEKPQAFRQRMKRCWKAGQAAAHVPFEQHPAELAEATRAVHTD